MQPLPLCLLQQEASRSGCTVEQLFERFGEKADFATIYIAEAHAAEEWSLKHSSNAELDGKWDVAQPKTMDERMKVFTDWYEWLSPTSPHFVDTISDEARFAFNALPERLYIIEDGKVVYRGDAGPFGYRESFLEQFTLAACDAHGVPPAGQVPPGGNRELAGLALPRAL